MKRCTMCGVELSDDYKDALCEKCLDNRKRVSPLGNRVIRKNLRGQAAWHTIAGVVDVVMALLFLAASIKGMEFKFNNFTYSTGAMWFSVACWLLLAGANFIYASRLRQYAERGKISKILELCVSASNAVVALITSPIACIYAVYNLLLAKRFIDNSEKLS